MILKWCKYEDKHALFLDLGEHSDKLCCLKVNKLDESIIRVLRANTNKLDKLSAYDAVQWIKANIPDAMSAYRTLFIKKTIVLNEYKIKSI